MRLTLEADYAVRIINCLCNDNNRLEARIISERCCITLRFTLKILHKLVTAGIVRSFKGTNGGYELNMKPSEITLRNVIETVEGTYFFSRCLEEPAVCSSGKKNCKFQCIFNDISTMVKEKLDNYTFDMFIEEKNIE
ncbi:MAG: Rrf2 family transcriptional regulator [Ruminococcus sp.]|nr:Rrf2 family transcriptional regulator [Ruminococcus sp.]